MDELVAWLREQVAADREVAERNSEGKGLANGYPDYQTNVDDDTRAADDHIERFGPKRVLDQREAHEAIIRYALEEDDKGDQDEHLIRLLALGYQHCDGYRDEWRP